MKITIDTREDSKEDIKKAILMLNALVGESVQVVEQEEIPIEKQSAMMGMFDSEPTVEEKEEPSEDEDDPQIMTY